MKERDGGPEIPLQGPDESVDAGPDDGAPRSVPSDARAGTGSRGRVHRCVRGAPRRERRRDRRPPGRCAPGLRRRRSGRRPAADHPQDIPHRHQPLVLPRRRRLVRGDLLDGRVRGPRRRGRAAVVERLGGVRRLPADRHRLPHPRPDQRRHREPLRIPRRRGDRDRGHDGAVGVADRATPHRIHGRRRTDSPSRWRRSATACSSRCSCGSRSHRGGGPPRCVCSRSRWAPSSSPTSPRARRATSMPRSPTSSSPCVHWRGRCSDSQVCARPASYGSSRPTTRHRTTSPGPSSSASRC